MVWLYGGAYQIGSGATPGATHGAEVGYVFSNVMKPGGAVMGETAADQPMADLVSGYWIHFAQTGDPNFAGAPIWPRYTGATDELLEFSDEGAVVHKNFHKTELDLITRRYLKRKGLAPH
jgi:para-nitrobenzyl esterase